MTDAIKILHCTLPDGEKLTYDLVTGELTIEQCSDAVGLNARDVSILRDMLGKGCVPCKV